MKKDNDAASMFGQGFNWSQALLAAYGTELGLDAKLAIKMGSAFGGGMGLMGETCGAVTSAVLLISLKYGANDREDWDAKKRAYQLTEKFIKEFRARNKSIVCRDLLGFNMKSDNYPENKEIISQRCPEFIAVASEILEEILRGEDDKIKK